MRDRPDRQRRADPSRVLPVDRTAVAAFKAASQFFVDAVSRVAPERYADAWSDEWTLLDLIAHANRANVLPVEYYERPVPVAGPEYVLPENIAARGRQAVRDLGNDPVAAVRAASERVSAMIDAAPDDASVGTPFGEMPLDVYLQSRTAELVLHGLDLGTDAEPPLDAVVGAGAFLVTTAARKGEGATVLRALSGRAPLPPDFSLY